MLLVEDVLRAEHEPHCFQPTGEAQQELDTAREGDGLQGGEVREQLFPARLFAADKVRTEHRQRLHCRLRSSATKQVGRNRQLSTSLDRFEARSLVSPNRSDG